MRIKYSVIIPVFNREDTIIRSINSVLNQKKYTNLEVIVINDGSTDKTEKNILSIKDRRLRYFKSDKNKGVNHARNIGIVNAVGDYLIFVDSDDYLVSNALLIISKFILLNPNEKHLLFNVSDRKDDTFLRNKSNRFTYEDWLFGRVSGDFLHVLRPACFQNRLFFERFRAFESLNWLRILKYSSPQLFINEVLCVIDRNRSDSLTKTLKLSSRKKIQEQLSFLCIFFSLYGHDLRRNKRRYDLIVVKAAFLALALNKKQISAFFINKLTNRKISAILRLLSRGKVYILLEQSIYIKSKFIKSKFL